MIPKLRSTTTLLAAAGALVTIALPGHAAETPDGADTYAVVALVGDEFSVVTYRPGVGSNIDQNIRQDVPLDDKHLDQLATRVAINAIHRVAPAATLQSIAVADEAAFGDADRLFASDGTLPALLTTVKPLLERPDTHYLVVISKYRGDAHLKVRSGTIGSGKLTGLGFYVDAYKNMKNSNTGERGRGFLAPYAYLMISLVDLRTGAVVRSETAVETATRANVGPQSTLEPWDALTPDQKAHLLDTMLGRAVQKTVPLVVAPA
jgi:hypothetical protein